MMPRHQTKSLKSRVAQRLHRLKQHPSQSVRIGAAILLIIGGLLGFLPVLGFWMLPLGLVLLVINWPPYWRARRRFVRWRRDRRQRKAAQSDSTRP